MTADLPPPALVRFIAPVEGVDLADGDVFIATRHRVRAVWVRQDATETVFVDDDGEVVARWATRLIERIDWPEVRTDRPPPEPGVGTTAWRDEVKAMFPRAWERWTSQEEDELTTELGDGVTVAEMARCHGRRPGGVMARLVRLGLVDADTPESAIGGRPNGRDDWIALGRPKGSSELRRAPEASATGDREASDRSAHGVRTSVHCSDDVCRHDLILDTCAICKYDDRPAVFITGGGVRYHASFDCQALITGQLHVEGRGGTTEPIESVHRGSARLEGRSACHTCGESSTQ